jgi:hypothetical protein
MAEFVNDDEIEDGGQPQVYRWRDFEDDACSESDVLNNEVRAFTDPGRRSHTSQYADKYDSSRGYIHLLPREEDLLWSVRVKVCRA